MGVGPISGVVSSRTRSSGTLLQPSGPSPHQTRYDQTKNTDEQDMKQVRSLRGNWIRLSPTGQRRLINPSLLKSTWPFHLSSAQSFLPPALAPSACLTITSSTPSSSPSSSPSNTSGFWQKSVPTLTSFRPRESNERHHQAQAKDNRDAEDDTRTRGCFRGEHSPHTNSSEALTDHLVLYLSQA